MCTLPPRFHEEKKKKQRGDIIVPAPFWCYTSNKTTEFPQCWLPTTLVEMFGPVSFLFRCSKRCREAGAWPCGCLKCDPSTLSWWTPSFTGSDYVKVEQALLSNIVGHSLFIWLYPQITYDVVDSKQSIDARNITFFGDTKTLLD